MRQLFLILILTLLAMGCQTEPKDPVKAERQLLDERYPPGANRGGIVLEMGSPDRSLVLSDEAVADPDEARIINDVQDRQARPIRRVDRYFVPQRFVRRGVYYDYLFYDEQDHLLTTVRRRVD